MLEGDTHTLTTPLGGLTFDRNSSAPIRAYVTNPTFDLTADREVVRYPSQDRSHVGDAWANAAIVTLVGVLEAPTRDDYLPERTRIEGYVNSLMRADGVLAWESYAIGPVQMGVRRHESPKISAKPEAGGMVVSLIAADPKVYSQAVTTTRVEAPTAVGGFTFPMTFPAVETASSPIATATNEGLAETFPIVRIYGPIRGPRIVNVTTGLQVSMPGLSVAAGDYVEIDMAPPASIRLNGSVLASRYDYLDPATSDFWALVSGENAIALYGTEYEAGVTHADVLHRNAWMPA